MKTCLIVDDSSIIRKVARRILEDLEFQISEAENGEDAVATCRRELPDAILLDWNMPKMDGYDFLRALRGLPGGDRPKVVFCTTENDVAHCSGASSWSQRILHEAFRSRYCASKIPRDWTDLMRTELPEMFTGLPATSAAGTKWRAGLHCGDNTARFGVGT